MKFLRIGLLTAMMSVLAGCLGGGEGERSTSVNIQGTGQNAFGVAQANEYQLPEARTLNLTVSQNPFQLTWTDSSGEVVMGTVASSALPLPTPTGIADGPFPLEPNPLLESATYQPFGWVIGTRERREIPASFFQGNQLYWAEAGEFVAVTQVSSQSVADDGTQTIELLTNFPGAEPAILEIKPLTGGTYRLKLTPPANIVDFVISTSFALASPANEAIYGLGARKDRFNQRGTVRNVWVEQQNTGSGQFGPVADPVFGQDMTYPNGGQAAYWVEAALWSSKGWSAWIDQTEVSKLDIGLGQAEAIRWHVASPELTLYMNGSGIERSSQAYTEFQGRAPAPPSYVYQPWIDVINEGEGEAAPNGQGFTGGERVRSDVLEIVQTAESLDIPLGLIGMEGWQSVPDIKSFVADLKAKGIRVAGYWNMFTSENATPETPERRAAYDEALSKQMFVGITEAPLPYQPFPIVTNRQGLSNLIDYSHSDAFDYWDRQLRRMFDLGIEAFMHDFGELTIEGMTYANGKPHSSMHNDYPRLYYEAARRASDKYAKENPGFEPFFYARAGYTGTSKYTPSVFPGDESTDWNEGGGLPSVIPAMLNLSLSGAYAFTTDVGGYLDLSPIVAEPTSKELMIRWSQLAALTPIMRIHNSTFAGSRMPWDFDDEAIAIYRRYAKLKVALAPMIDAWAERAASEGVIGPVRPVSLEDQSIEALSVKDQWLLGRGLLVAPIVQPGAISREVYFPSLNGASEWEQVLIDPEGEFVRTGKVFEAGATEEVVSGLADIPLFVAIKP